MNTTITEAAIRTIAIAISYNFIIGMLWNSPRFLGKYLGLYEEYKEVKHVSHVKPERTSIIKLKPYHWVIFDSLLYGIGIWYAYEEFFKSFISKDFSITMMAIVLWILSAFGLLFREKDDEDSEGSEKKLTIKDFLSNAIYSFIIIAGTIYIVTHPL